MRHVFEHGGAKADRTGTGTRSVFGHQMQFDLNDGFPLVTTKRTATKHANSPSRNIIDVRSKLADLLRIESVLATLVDDCCASHGTVSCPLIAALQKRP